MSKHRLLLSIKLLRRVGEGGRERKREGGKERKG